MTNTDNNKATDNKNEYKWKTIEVFQPTAWLKKYRALLSSIKYLLYILPLCLFAAGFILLNYTPPEVGIGGYGTSDGFSLSVSLIMGILTVNVLGTLATASVAYAYGGTVNSIILVLFYGFLPRFRATLDDTKKFTRKEKLWFHASPLLARLGMFSFGVLLWSNSMYLGGFIPQFGSSLAWISVISFALTACPFYTGSGYYFLSEFLNEPELRRKAFVALLNKWNKNIYVHGDTSPALVVYAMACVLFTAVLLLFLLLVFYLWIQPELGSFSLIVIGILTIYGGYKLWNKMNDINKTYHKNQKFERWRERVVPDEVRLEENDEKKSGAFSINVKNAVIISVLIFLICPYPYQPSGKIVVLPITRQQVSTDIAGIIDMVYFEGGESLKKHTIIARLSVRDHEAQLAIQKAKLEEQKAYIKQLKSKPTAEDVKIAEEKLQVAKVQNSFSQEKCARQKILYKSDTISLDEMEITEKICEVDKQQIVESEANLARVLAGIPQEQIVVAETALLPIMAQINLYKDQIARSAFKMPFDGKLTTLHLKERQGNFLERGEPLAMAEDDSKFKVVLYIPETDLPFIRIGANTKVRTMAYPERTFKGIVTAIDPDVEDNSSGKMVKMIVTLEKDKDLLKSGMTGYAKIKGDSLMVWQILTRAIYRFIIVEVWAWIP